MKYLTKTIIILILTIVLYSCKETSKHQKIIIDRIEYIYNLKLLINKNTWIDFSNSKYDIPLVYYTDSNCYVTNPTDYFIDLFNPELINKNNNSKSKKLLYKPEKYQIQNKTNLGRTLKN